MKIEGKLLEEWDWEKNNPIDPLNVNSSLKVWWIGPCGHEWDDTITHRKAGRGCPYCSGKRVWAGFNDLLSQYPDIASEWNYQKNELKPNEIMAHSNKRYWWIGKCGHEWETSPNERSRGRGCPYCSNQKVLVGFNDFASKQPELLKEWDYERNGFQPDSITEFSNRKAYWVCAKSHKWEAVIGSRTKNGNGCPYCVEQKVLKGYNDLETLNPDIASEWNYERNGSVTPDEIAEKDNHKYWWKGKCGHEWDDTVAHRTSDKRNCPYCAGKRVLEGDNDIFSNYSELMADWNFEKNKMDPKTIAGGSHKKVHWKCHICNKEWVTTVKDRCLAGHGCPRCSSALKTSFPEQAIYFYLSKCFDIVLNGDKKAIGMELDIYIPAIKVAIEYDGSFYHKETNQHREIKKDRLCKDHGISLIRIKENGCAFEHNDCVLLFRENNYSDHSLKDVIMKLGEVLKIQIGPIDLQSDRELIEANYIVK